MEGKSFKYMSYTNRAREVRMGRRRIRRRGGDHESR